MESAKANHFLIANLNIYLTPSYNSIPKIHMNKAQLFFFTIN